MTWVAHSQINMNSPLFVHWNDGMILNEEGNGFQPLKDMLLYSLGGYMMKTSG